MTGLHPVTARPRPDMLYHVVWLALAAGIFIAAASLSVRNGAQVVVPFLNWPLPQLCAFQGVAGVPCPGCGLTRSCIALTHGNLAGSWHYNPAGMILIPLLAVQIPYRWWQLTRIRRGLPEATLPLAAPLALGGLAAMLLGQWALRLAGVNW